jgi:hypothetical protein
MMEMGGWDLQKTAPLIAAATVPDLEAATTDDDELRAPSDGNTTAPLRLPIEAIEAAVTLEDDG